MVDLICFYMWLRVLISWKVVIYSDGDNIIIIIIIIIIVIIIIVVVVGFLFKVVCVGYVGITLVALVFRW